MAKEYLEKLSLILEQTTVDQFEHVHLECKHFFSGAAVYADGKICLSLTPLGFAIKLPEESRKVLTREKGALALRYFPKSPIKKDYVLLPQEMLDDINGLQSWVQMAIEYALTLPKSANKKSHNKKSDSKKR